MSSKSNYANSSGRDENGNPDKEETAAKVDELISQDRVVIFSKPTCPYCDDAKKVFDKLGQSYSTVDISNTPNGRDVQTVLKEKTGAGTVPRVFVDGVCIGGGNDTVQMYQNGKLEKILRQRSAESVASDKHGYDENANRNANGSGEKFY